MSKSAGIVAEYNPFHTGHRYQIDFLKKNGYSKIAVAMSGSCVQRGSLAMINKFDRAKMALKNGVSLVAEIPFPFSCQSAEGYAMAGIQTLKALGVEAVCFGSESGDISLLKQVAEYLLSDRYETRLKGFLGQNMPFASAREKAIIQRFGLNKELISASNDILAIEYIKACLKLDWHPELIALKRVGAGYNDLSAGGRYASASGIRRMISEYRYESAMKYIPRESTDIFTQNLDRGSFFLPDVSWEKAVLFTLRQKTAADFAKIPDCNTELSHSFEKAVSVSDSVDSLFDNLPTKRYTRARLNRIILHAMLDVADNMPKDIQYIRLLGFDKTGEQWLKDISRHCPLPVSHSAKILSEKSEECRKIVQTESRACDTQAIFCKISGEPRQDYTRKIAKV